LTSTEHKHTAAEYKNSYGAKCYGSENQNNTKHVIFYTTQIKNYRILQQWSSSFSYQYRVLFATITYIMHYFTMFFNFSKLTGLTSMWIQAVKRKAFFSVSVKTVLYQESLEIHSQSWKMYFVLFPHSLYLQLKVGGRIHIICKGNEKFTLSELF
jgi:hypothetical protein